MGKRSAAAAELSQDVSMSAAAGDESLANTSAAGLVTGEEPKKKKSKKDKSGDKVAAGPSEEELVALELCPIAHPLASAKMGKKVLKTVKKASKQRHIKRGVKEVVKALRKKEQGLVVLAADISPMDILSHLPVLAEDSQNPYIFVTSKEALGAASATKRPTSCVMIVPDASKLGKKAAEMMKVAQRVPEKKEALEEYKAAYDELHKDVSKLNDTIISA